MASADCGVIEDLPTGWRGIIHDLGMSLGIAEATPGEREAQRQSEQGKEAGQ